MSVLLCKKRLVLDVLVHGEPERNDMVEYFGELMQGFYLPKDGYKVMAVVV